MSKNRRKRTAKLRARATAIQRRLEAPRCSEWVALLRRPPPVEPGLRWSAKLRNHGAQQAGISVMAG